MSGLAAASLAGEATTLAVCWRLRRADGLVLGFTSHDRDLWAEGLWYRANPGMTPSAVVADASLEPASAEMEGVLDGGVLSVGELQAGRWEGAEVEMRLLDWMTPAAGGLTLLRGAMGDVSRVGGGFRVEIAGDARRLAEGGAPLCSPLCRAALGDRACGVDMAGRRAAGVVAAVEGDCVTLAGEPAGAADYAFGRLRVLTGAGAGVDRGIAAVDGARVLLEAPLEAGVRAGDVVRLEEGCDGRFATCCGRFGNGLRFQGEPHVPGTDALLRYGEL